MKKGKPLADRPERPATTPREGEYPFFSGSCSPSEHFRMAIENRDLRTRLGTLGKRLSEMLKAAKRIRNELLAKNRALETRVSYLEAVLSSTDAAVIVADTTGEIRIFNQGAERIFQLEADTVVGEDNLFRLCTDFAAKDDRSFSQRRLVDTFVQEQSIANMRIEFIGNEGKITPCLFTLNFVEDKGDRVAIVAVIKDNTEVEGLTRTDELTEIANRRHLLHMLKREYARLERGHYENISILFFDVDNFGKFNKDYGHQVGDEVLRVVGSITKQKARWLDTVGRYGGEEFVVVMPGTDAEGANIAAERIRAAIAESRVPTREFGGLSVTVSIGSQTHGADGINDVDSFVKEANTAMLIAKHQGKNRVLRYEPGHTDIMRRLEASKKDE